MLQNHLFRPTSGFSSLWLALLTRTHQRMRDYKECLQQNLPTNIFPVWLSVEFRNTNHINSFYGKFPMQEKSYTSLWLGSIMVLMQRTLDWGNSLEISLSSLCIEVKRVRKKSRPRNPQDDVFEQFHAAIHAYNTNETKISTFRFDSLWAHSTVSVSGFATGRPNLDPYMTYLVKSL